MDATSRRRARTLHSRQAVRPTTSSSAGDQAGAIEPGARESAIPLVRAFMPPPPAWDAARPASARRPARQRIRRAQGRPAIAVPARAAAQQFGRGQQGLQRLPRVAAQRDQIFPALCGPPQAAQRTGLGQHQAAAVAQRGAMPRQAGRQQIVAGPKPPAACRGHAFQRVEQAGIDAERQPRSAVAARIQPQAQRSGDAALAHQRPRIGLPLMIAAAQRDLPGQHLRMRPRIADPHAQPVTPRAAPAPRIGQQFGSRAAGSPPCGRLAMRQRRRRPQQRHLLGVDQHGAFIP